MTEKKWITDGIENRRVVKDESPPIGWRLGRSYHSRKETTRPYMIEIARLRSLKRNRDANGKYT